MFPVDIAKFFKIAFPCNTSDSCFWQSYHGTVKSAGVPVLWIRASTCFRFWSKTFTKRWSNNSLLSRDKTISSLLDLINHVLLISDQNRFWKNINCFCFWWKTYKKCCTSNYKISHVKRLSFPCTLRLVWCFRFKSMIWTAEHGGGNPDGQRNMAVEIPILVLLCFCLLCWLKKHLFCVLSLL